jgi:hypothetical protein
MTQKCGLLVSVMALGIAFFPVAPADATSCWQYLDSRAGAHPGGTMCWLSGMICYECCTVDPEGNGACCSSNWQPCSPGGGGTDPNFPIASVCSPNDGAVATAQENLGLESDTDRRHAAILL